MPAIRIGAKPLLLPADVQLALERNSSWLAPREQNGSFSLPFKAPLTDNRHNNALLGFPERFDHAGRPPRRYDQVQAFDDTDNRVAAGQLVLQGIEQDGYSLNLVCGLSAVMTRLKQKSLREFWFGGPRQVCAGTVNNWGELSDLIGQHMLDVVDDVDAYDYVFAPFCNNDAYADHDDKLPHWPNMNNWVNDGFQIHNGYSPPAPGATDPSMVFDPATVTSCVPLPKLAYVLAMIFEELDIPFEQDLFTDRELRQMVVLSTTPIEYNTDWYDWTTSADINLTFRIANQLPDISAAEFVRLIADTYYLDLDLSPAGAVRLRRTNRLSTARPAQDLTKLVGPGFTRDFAELAVRATYLTEDTVAGKLTQEVEPPLLAEPVQSSLNLPTPSRPNEIRLATFDNLYYQHDGEEWRPYAVNLPPVVVGNGENPQDVPQGILLSVELNVPATPSDGVSLRVPVIGQRAYLPLLNQLERGKGLRLAFYRGIQPGYGRSYPMVSISNQNINRGRIGNYSLYLDGEDGLVAKFGQLYLQMLAEQPAKFPAYLTGYDFDTLNFGEPVSVRGDIFLIRRANVVLPITRPGTLELVPRRNYGNTI
ncbi:hypothetical protein [Hymenobacter sp. BT190]|uniref:hypothetical protein n=1 Tax=Hymenobacter sp. BT190 TaxID=2763505 RepID=UPI0016519FEA|nr:hypothetical protein [Hymenobacter sp. BT190]MBC6698094.1 hypothetical protein [Hymenobacter sp. BT190]